MTNRYKGLKDLFPIALFIKLIVLVAILLPSQTFAQAPSDENYDDDPSFNISSNNFANDGVRYQLSGPTTYETATTNNSYNLSEGGPSDYALNSIDEDGIGGLTEITISSDDGSAFQLAGLSFDILSGTATDRDIQFTSDNGGNFTLPPSDGDFVSYQDYDFTSESGFGDITSFTISGTNMVIDIDDLNFEPAQSSNSAPTDLSLSSATVNQSDAANATVGTLSTTDADGGDTHSYSLVAGTGDDDNASFNISGSTLRADDASSLAPGNYSVRIQTDDGNGGTYEKAFSVTVNDDVAPSFENSTPAVSATTESQTTLTVQLDEIGTAYYVVVADGDGAPSATQVKAGQNSSSSAAIASGNINVSSASQDFTDDITGLSPNTAYDIYVVAEDDEGSPNLQSNTTKVDVTMNSLGSGGVLYVDKNVSGGDGSGNSWANALPELADALQFAKANESNWTAANPLQIWVAKGIYHPVSPADPNNVTQAEREATFQLINNVEIYGGFAGTESALDQRNWSSNMTVLSGDIDGDDTVNSDGVVTNTDDISGANSYSVVTGTGTDETAILNGLSITAGYAQSCQSVRTDPGCAGAGMYNGTGSNFRLLNLRFIGNHAATLGGAMFNDVNSDPTLINVSMVNNVADQEGGAMRNRGASPILVNSTITGNTGGSDGAIFNSNSSNIVLTNTILWGNTGGNIFNLISTPDISYSLVEGIDNTGNNGLDGTDPNNAPQFTDPANGDYSLKATSPAVDAGSNSAYTNAGGDLQNDLDLAGNPRVYDGVADPDTIDIGAYELQGEPNRAPKFTSTADTTGIEGQPYTYAIETSDPDGDALTIIADQTPNWANFTDNGDGTATLQGTPGFNNMGDVYVKLDVSDGNLSATQEFTISVGDSNRAPGFTSTPLTQARED